MVKNIAESFASVLGSALGGAVQGVQQSFSNPKDPGTIPLGLLGQIGSDLYQYMQRDLEAMEIKNVQNLKPGDEVFHVQIDPQQPQHGKIWSGKIQAINPQDNTFYLLFADPNTKLARGSAASTNPTTSGVKTTSPNRTLTELLDRTDLYIFYIQPADLTARPGVAYTPVPMQPGDINKVPFGPTTNYIQTWYRQADLSRVRAIFQKSKIQLASFFPKFSQILAEKSGN